MQLLKEAELEKIKEFDPENDKVDRMIMEQVISEKKNVRRSSLYGSTNSMLNSSLNHEPDP